MELNMKTMLVRLCDATGLELVEQARSSILRIRRPPDLVFDVTVPHDVLEWFVDARDNSGSIWSEWADYYPTDGETRGQLLVDMASDIERFVTVLMNSEVRVLHDPAKADKGVELAVAGSWRRADLSWMTADKE
jgi:hypothetical protein